MSRKADFLACLLTALLVGACAQRGAPPPLIAPAAPIGQPLVVPLTRPDADPLGTSVTARIRALDPQAYRAVTALAAGGRVMLAGVVVKPAQRRRAERAAAAAPGVVAVRNEILLAEEPAFDQFRPDIAHEAALIVRLAALGGRGELDLRVLNSVAYVVAGPRTAEQAARLRDALAEDAALKWTVVDIAP